MSLVGRHIGRYRILEQLGQGGMSVVYKGLDTTLDREVAVKVLHTHLAAKVESRKRLEREAKAVARLHHPNILEVFDFAGADAAEAYIVTEYIRGQTLRQFITDTSLQPPEIAAMVMHEIASALGHAHDAGVIHRDLKPENVMVREDGVIKLMDFGIAKILDRDEKMTMTGALVGSPAHMAPEIIEGEEAGPEADVFSLGTMLYLFATGKLPFTAPNTTATLKRILDCAYDDPRQVVPTVSDELAEIIGTCLQRQPGNRYATASKLRDALASYLGDLGLTRAHEELPKFFLDPKSYRKEVITRVTTALLARAEKLLAEKRSAKAMSALNQVLAHDPSNLRAVELLDQMKARKIREQRAKRLVRLSVLGGAGFIVLMGVLQGVAYARRAPDYRLPTTLDPTDVRLGAVSWTKPPAKNVKAVIFLRPAAYLTVDKGPRAPEAKNSFSIDVDEGPHELLVTCDACEPGGVTTVTDIRPDAPITIVAPLRPSTVRFDGFPPEALVRVGDQERTVAQTQSSPFVVSMGKEGVADPRYPFAYEVTHQGKSLAKRELSVEAGKETIVRPTDARPAPRVDDPKRPVISATTGSLDVQVMVRPWGFLSIDKGARSADALAVHNVKLNPGPHEFTVTCDACESAGVTRVAKVATSGERVSLVAPLKPSLVSFAGFPSEATVRIGAEQRTVAETKLNPFRVTTPPEGCREMYHLVKYEVVLAGQSLERGERKIEPGHAALIERKGP